MTKPDVPQSDPFPFRLGELFSYEKYGAGKTFVRKIEGEGEKDTYYDMLMNPVEGRVTVRRLQVVEKPAPQAQPGTPSTTLHIRHQEFTDRVRELYSHYYREYRLAQEPERSEVLRLYNAMRTLLSVIEYGSRGPLLTLSVAICETDPTLISYTKIPYYFDVEAKRTKTKIKPFLDAVIRELKENRYALYGSLFNNVYGMTSLLELTDKEVEEVSTLYGQLKPVAEMFRFEVVRGKDVLDTYLNLKGTGSCMEGSLKATMYSHNPNSVELVRVYRQDVLIGRAMLYTMNTGEKYLDNVYPKDGGLHVRAIKNWAHNLGYFTSQDSQKPTGKKNGVIRYIPLQMPLEMVQTKDYGKIYPRIYPDTLSIVGASRQGELGSMFRFYFSYDDAAANKEPYLITISNSSSARCASQYFDGKAHQYSNSDTRFSSFEDVDGVFVPRALKAQYEEFRASGKYAHLWAKEVPFRAGEAPDAPQPPSTEVAPVAVEAAPTPAVDKVKAKGPQRDERGRFIKKADLKPKTSEPEPEANPKVTLIEY